MRDTTKKYEKYLVDLERGSCTCPDPAKGNTYKHLLAAVLLERAERNGYTRSDYAFDSVLLAQNGAGDLPRLRGLEAA